MMKAMYLLRGTLCSPQNNGGDEDAFNYFFKGLMTKAFFVLISTLPLYTLCAERVQFLSIIPLILVH